MPICRRVDGSDWLLGSGSFGQVLHPNAAPILWQCPQKIGCQPSRRSVHMRQLEGLRQRRVRRRWCRRRWCSRGESDQLDSESTERQQVAGGSGISGEDAASAGCPLAAAEEAAAEGTAAAKGAEDPSANCSGRRHARGRYPRSGIGPPVDSASRRRGRDRQRCRWATTPAAGDVSAVPASGHPAAAMRRCGCRKLALRRGSRIAVWRPQHSGGRGLCRRCSRRSRCRC